MDALNSHREDTVKDSMQHGIERTPDILPGMELRQFIGVFSRQYKAILSTLAVVIGLAVLALSLLDDRYTASAMLVVDESESKMVGIDALLSAGATLNNPVDTEVEILKSSSVALGTIEKLHLWDDDEFGLDGSLWGKLSSIVSKPSDRKTVETTPSIMQLADDQRAELVESLIDSLKISRRGLTNVISIDATSKSAKKAARIANAVAESYFDVQIEARAKSAQRAAEFLRARVNELATAIREDNQHIDQFLLERSDQIGTPDTRAQLVQLRNEITSITREQNAKATDILRWQDFQNDLNPDHISEFANAATIRRLAAEAPLVKETAAQLEELVTREISNLRQQVASNDNRMATVSQQMRDLIGQQTLPQAVAVDLYKLQRNAETNRKLYDSYVSRLGEVQQSISLAIPNSRIMAPAIVPHQPSFPPTMIILGLTGLLGLGLGGGAALLRERIIGGFTSPEQLEAVVGLPVVSVIPQYQDTHPHDAILKAPFSEFAESIRRLRIAVENTMNGVYPSVVLVTSSEPNEGKTTLAIALARTIARSGRRTLLIDCDLRNSSVSERIAIVSPMTLVELLLSPVMDEHFKVALQVEKDSGLWLINSEAKKRPGSDVLLASPQFKKFMDIAKSQFDVIIMDSPPIGYVVDAAVLSRECDVVLYVTQYATTNQREVVAGLRQIVSSSKPPLPLIALNGSHEVLGSHYYRKRSFDKYYSQT
jgi:polysaccharide biosynthesis transport protein